MIAWLCLVATTVAATGCQTRWTFSVASVHATQQDLLTTMDFAPEHHSSSFFSCADDIVAVFEGSSKKMPK